MKKPMPAFMSKDKAPAAKKAGGKSPNPFAKMAPPFGKKAAPKKK
jgi:hypothetical protein